MLAAILFLAVCFLALANGANDNFKGVASLYGGGTCGYRKSLAWATGTTLAGSVTALFLAQALLAKFSGRGLVPDALVASPHFVLAVALGAGGTVVLAAWFGFPISTTHGLIGALVGAGLTAGSGVNFGKLGSTFVLPLLLSPLLAVCVGAVLYLILRFVRLRIGVTKEMCVCAGVEERVIALPQPGGVFAVQMLPALSIAVDDPAVCSQRYAGRVLGINARTLLDGLHFLSAGAVSFARGLNDTPKIAALLLTAAALDVHWGLLAVAAAMALGGVFGARRVAETMSHKLTSMNPGQGFAANLSTALLVTTASLHGLPVSTTHVSVGSLLGMGAVTRQARLRPVLGVLASWVVTFPCAALLAALSSLLIHVF